MKKIITIKVKTTGMKFNINIPGLKEREIHNEEEFMRCIENVIRKARNSGKKTLCVDIYN